uniref:Uncharacterized protein n=1 Tax=Rhizophora mucronata TaxID=61149 RepID=A0A2P2P6C0_RHIMU
MLRKSEMSFLALLMLTIALFFPHK